MSANAGTTATLFAAGPNGIRLDIPGVPYVAVSINEGQPLSETQQRALIAQALAQPSTGSSLKELARGKRRAVILAGGLSRPAPYDIVLPAIVAALVEAEIRPSRIGVVACPGSTGTLLGRAAIHRYGEEICGEHEVIPWPATGTPGPIFDSADLGIAVAPEMDGVPFDAFLPLNVSVDAALVLKLGRTLQFGVESARLQSPLASVSKGTEQTIQPSSVADVLITSGGGSPWEETLEEALFGLNAPQTAARTAVLVFSGSEGLGSSRFARDYWSLIEQAEEVLAGGGNLGVPSSADSPDPSDPAGVLADCLRRYKNTILFSPELTEHPEGEDLLERLAAAPHVFARMSLCGRQAELWQALSILHGEHYSVHAEPLGWRGRY